MEFFNGNFVGERKTLSGHYLVYTLRHISTCKMLDVRTFVNSEWTLFIFIFIVGQVFSYNYNESSLIPTSHFRREKLRVAVFRVLWF